MDIGDDERFVRGIALFNEREFEAAGELFEELFFEAVRGEVEIARALLQFAAGAHHVERGQRRVAIERIDEGIVALRQVVDARGIDANALRASMACLIAWCRDPAKPARVPWPRIERG